MKRWYHDIKRVKQVDDHGCAIACTAAVCGTTYLRARREFFPRRRTFKDDDTLHLSSARVIDVIRLLGYRAQLVADFSWTFRPAILFFSWFKDNSDRWIHTVVWDPFKRRIVDPGYDHDRHMPNSYYFDINRRSGYAAVVVTGKL